MIPQNAQRSQHKSQGDKFPGAKIKGFVLLCDQLLISAYDPVQSEHTNVPPCCQRTAMGDSSQLASQPLRVTVLKTASSHSVAHRDDAGYDCSRSSQVTEPFRFMERSVATLSYLVHT